jgi:uncharacterized protein
VLTDDLLELQRIDTTLDQLDHRRVRLPQRDEATAAQAAVRELERRRAELSTRSEELVAAIEDLERDGATITTQKRRLEGQLKTVVSARQAEALTHELDALDRRRDELDDRELAHLEEQSTVAAELVEVEGQLPPTEQRLAVARTSLGEVESEIDADIARLRAERSALAGRFDADVLRRYEALRSRFGGVAVARLDGSRCGGCYLDLSTAERDRVRSTPAGEFADCPQCGRLLVP